MSNHYGHKDGEWFWACEACSGLPDNHAKISTPANHTGDDHQIAEMADIIWDTTDGDDEDAPEVAARKLWDAGYRKVSA